MFTDLHFAYSYSQNTQNCLAVNNFYIMVFIYKLVSLYLFTGQLLKAAEMKEDTSILVHIQDKDCVSMEVRYHCYRQYTRFLTKSTATVTGTSEEQ